MIQAVEKGRRLHVTIGGDDEAIEFVVPPVNVETGARLLATFVRAYTGNSSDPINDSVTLSRLALGDENYERGQELRSDEFTNLFRAAFYWNTFGGGTDALNTFLEAGEGKATGDVFLAAGVQLKPLSKTSPPTESESPTP